MSGRPEYLPDIVAGEWLDDGSRHVTLTRPHSGRVASLALPFTSVPGSCRQLIRLPARGSARYVASALSMSLPFQYACKQQ